MVVFGQTVVEGQGTSIFITLPCEVIEDGDWDE
ncbi:two-component sensor histidine kinase [Staphylococcus aureus]|uniref:Two-component sensor histidine kinase n=1 Tax=Staphylococcus aureus TaxID=1280 RepID=A0A380DHI4_STAAU|nr:two-component sensor histidine kinase [Staphylococcus aureus]